MSGVVKFPVDDSPISNEAMRNSPIYKAILAECATCLSLISEMAFKDPKAALRQINDIKQVPTELLYLKEAVMTHVIHLVDEDGGAQ